MHPLPPRGSGVQDESPCPCSVSTPQRDSALMRQTELDAIARGGCQQLLDFLLGRRRNGRTAVIYRSADFKEHFLESGRSDENEHSGWSITLVLERVQRSDRNVCKHPGASHQALF